MNEKNIQLFFRILKNKGAYEKYFDNFFLRHSIDDVDPYTYWKYWANMCLSGEVFGRKISMLVSGAFNFVSSDEGSEFWWDIVRELDKLKL